MIFLLEILKSLICGGTLIGFWFHICWYFIFLVFSFLRRLQLAVGRASSLYFAFSFSTVSVAVEQYSRWVFFNGYGSIFMVGSRRGFRCSSVRCVPYCIWEVFVWPVVWVCVLFFGSGRLFVSPLNIGQFLENVLWSSPQWQHLSSVVVHLSLLSPWQLHFAHVAIVSWHLFTVCRYLRHVLQLISLS